MSRLGTVLRVLTCHLSGIRRSCRSVGQRAAIAVNECGVPCKIHVLNLGRGDQKAADYLKINPTPRGAVRSVVGIEGGVVSG
jgi:hypothetical protein